MLDFLVISVSWLGLLDNKAVPSSLRAFRVVRPLRAIVRLPKLNHLVDTIFSALPQLGYVVVFVMLYFVVFGILGLHLWHGRLQQRCQFQQTVWTTDANNSATSALAVAYGGYCPHVGEALLCQDGQVCQVSGENPRNGLLGFDNFFQALLVVFVTLTASGWQEVLHITQDTSGYAVPTGVIFVFMVLFGSYYCVNVRAINPAC